MPIEKREASRLCKKYLSSLPDFSDRERADVIIESVAEICTTEHHAQKTLATWRAGNRTLPTYADLLQVAEEIPTHAAPIDRSCEKCRGSGWVIVDVLITMEPTLDGREYRRLQRITEQQARDLQLDDDFRKVQATGAQMLNSGAKRCACGVGVAR